MPTGLAFSGGGLRSALFCLGISQAFHKTGLWKCIDYLSTVSGGGYVGSYLASAVLKNQSPLARDSFPLSQEALESQREQRNACGAGESNPKPNETKRVKAVRPFIFGGRYLIRPWELANRYLIGFLLTNLSLISGVTAICALIAFLWRCLDYPAFRDRIRIIAEATGIPDLDSDGAAAFYPFLLFFVAWLIAWGLSYFRRETEAKALIARMLLFWMAASFLIGLALVLSSGTLSIPLYGTIEPAHWSSKFWGPFAALLGGSLLPFLSPRRLLRSGRRDSKFWEKCLFNFATTGLLIGVPIALIGYIGRENISGYQPSPWRPTGPKDHVDWERIYGVILPKGFLGDAVADSNLAMWLDVISAFDANGVTMAHALPELRQIHIERARAAVEEASIISSAAGSPWREGVEALKALLAANAAAVSSPALDPRWPGSIQAVPVSEDQLKLAHALADKLILDLSSAKNDAPTFGPELHTSLEVCHDALLLAEDPYATIRKIGDRTIANLVSKGSEAGPDDVAQFFKEVLQILESNWRAGVSSMEAGALFGAIPPAHVDDIDGQHYHATQRLLDLLRREDRTPGVLDDFQRLNLKDLSKELAHISDARARRGARTFLVWLCVHLKYQDIMCETYRKRVVGPEEWGAWMDPGKPGRISQMLGWLLGIDRRQNSSNPVLSLRQWRERRELTQKVFCTALNAFLKERANGIEFLPNEFAAAIAPHYRKREQETVLRVIVIHEDQAARLWIAGAGGLFFLLGLFVNLNATSLHGFYRDRIRKAFIVQTGEKSLSPMLSSLHTTAFGYPYLILSGTLHMPQSRLSEDFPLLRRARPARNTPPRMAPFIFSQAFCGSESTGYVETKEYEEWPAGDLVRVDLSEATALSGAAVSPSQFENSLLAVLMIALNLRLGQWLPNPKRGRPASRPLLWRQLCDLCRRPLRRRHLLVSDGAFTENLGVYQLLQRRCRLIVSVDAGCDAEHSFRDLARVITIARTEGIEFRPVDRHDVESVVGPLRFRTKDEADQTAGRGLDSYGHCVAARITYPGIQEEGLLIYVKPSFTGDESDDLLEYRKSCPEFPHESTGDQIYEWEQSEAYRLLGYHIGMKLCAGIPPGKDGSYLWNKDIVWDEPVSERTPARHTAKANGRLNGDSHAIRIREVIDALEQAAADPQRSQGQEPDQAGHLPSSREPKEPRYRKPAVSSARLANGSRHRGLPQSLETRP